KRIHVHYNLLYGFPGDTKEEYENLAATIPMLYHLRPPVSVVPVLMTRFAPLQATPEKFGISGPLRYHERYNVTFSRDFLAQNDFNLDEYCYYFDRPYSHDGDLEELFSVIEAQVNYWRKLYSERSHMLTFKLTSGGIEFKDFRYTDKPKYTVFSQLHAEVYLAISGCISNAHKIAKALSSKLSFQQVEKVIEDFSRERLVLRSENKVTGLALSVEVCSLPAPALADRWAPPYTSMETVP